MVVGMRFRFDGFGALGRRGAVRGNPGDNKAMTTYIAHNCPNCGALVYIVPDTLSFADENHLVITDCPNCAHKLTIPRGLMDTLTAFDDTEEYDE